MLVRDWIAEKGGVYEGFEHVWEQNRLSKEHQMVLLGMGLACQDAYERAGLSTLAPCEC